MASSKHLAPAPPPAPFDTFCQQIQTHLEAASDGSGHRSPTVFRDWLALSQASFDALPLHLRSVIETGQVAPPEADTPDTQALFAKMRQRYPQAEQWEHLSAALHLLLESTRHGYYDVLGYIYMAYAGPNLREAQYFTPWPLAQLMATLVVQDGPAEVMARLNQAARQAAEENALVQAILFATGVTTQALEHNSEGISPLDVLDEQMVIKLLELILPYYHPLKICEPAVGSGVLLLAIADKFPEWMVRAGLVQFYGTDIDYDCVAMARLNLQLYGLNGSGLKFIQATNDPALTARVKSYRQQQQAITSTTPDDLTTWQTTRETTLQAYLSLFETATQVQYTPSHPQATNNTTAKSPTTQEQTDRIERLQAEIPSPPTQRRNSTQINTASRRKVVAS